MKKYLSVLALLGLFAFMVQPAFSQCGCCPQLTGCACPVQEVCAPVCPPQITYQNKLVAQPVMTYQQKCIKEPVISYQTKSFLQPKIVYEQKSVCEPIVSYQNRTVLEQRMAYHFRNVCEPVAVCPQPVTGCAAPICNPCNTCQPQIIGAAMPIHTGFAAQCCPCPGRRSGWQIFTQELLGFGDF